MAKDTPVSGYKSLTKKELYNLTHQHDNHVWDYLQYECNRPLTDADMIEDDIVALLADDYPRDPFDLGGDINIINGQWVYSQP